MIILFTSLIFGVGQFAFSESYNVSTIDFSGRPTSAVVNENANVIYVTDFFAGKVFEIDGKTDKILGHIDVTRTSFGVGYNPATDLIYVGGEFSNVVKVINAGTKETERNISMQGPYDIAINSKANIVYVTSDRTNTVFVIDGETNQITLELNVDKPCGIAVNSVTGRVYVTSETDDAVYVFEKNKLIEKIPVESSPRGVAVNEKTNTIYVANQESNTISVIDGVSNTVTDSISVGEIPRRVAIQLDSNLIYVTNHGSNEISVISGENNSVIKTIPVNEPFEITINQNTNKVYSMYIGKPGISVIQKTDSGDDKFDFQIISKDREEKSLEKPLKQFFSGVHPIEIKCKESYELIFKNVSLQPACVSPQSAEKLIQRGWAISKIT